MCQHQSFCSGSCRSRRRFTGTWVLLEFGVVKIAGHIFLVYPPLPLAWSVFFAQQRCVLRCCDGAALRCQWKLEHSNMVAAEHARPTAEVEEDYGELGAMELITCCVPTMWIPGCTWFTIVTTELYRYNSLRVRLFPCFYLRRHVFTLAVLLVLSTVPQHSPFFQTHGTQLPSPSEVRDGKLESFQRDPVQSLEARLRKQLLTLKNKNKIFERKPTGENLSLPRLVLACLRRY